MHLGIGFGVLGEAYGRLRARVNACVAAGTGAVVPSRPSALNADALHGAHARAGSAPNAGVGQAVEGVVEARMQVERRRRHVPLVEVDLLLGGGLDVALARLDVRT